MLNDTEEQPNEKIVNCLAAHALFSSESGKPGSIICNGSSVSTKASSTKFPTGRNLQSSPRQLDVKIMMFIPSEVLRKRQSVIKRSRHNGIKRMCSSL